MKSYLNKQLISCMLLTASLSSQERLQLPPVTVGQDSFVATGYEVLMKTADEWKTVATFGYPTVSLLLKYRAHVRSYYGFNEAKYSFFDVVEEIHSSVSSVYAADRKVWVGFDFYEGEFWDGYGGIGFYDPNSHRIGVLRHPALIDYSVKALMITDTILYVKTIGQYELSRTLGNGLVMIDRNTLFARALVPPGTSVLRSKDDPVSADSFYNKPISQILTDIRFLNKTVPQYPSNVLEHFRRVGLDSFMVETEQYERSMRDSGRVHGRTAVDTVLTLTPKEPHAYVLFGNDRGIAFELIEGLVVGFALGERQYRLYVNAGEHGIEGTRDTVVENETQKYHFSVRLKDFVPEKEKLGVESVTFQALVKEIR